MPTNLENSAVATGLEEVSFLFFFFFFFYAFLICKAVKKKNPVNQKPYVSINLFALIQNRSNRAVTEKAVATGLLLF